MRFGEPVPKGGGTYRVGKPYMIGGRTYSPEENAGYSAEGIASWYGEDFHGRQTANGEVYDMQSISAAHPTLPIPSYARVTNLANQRSIIVRVNDRGPYHAGPPDRRVGAHRAAARLLTTTAPPACGWTTSAALRLKAPTTRGSRPRFVAARRRPGLRRSGSRPRGLRGRNPMHLRCAAPCRRRRAAVRTRSRRAASSAASAKRAHARKRSLRRSSVPRSDRWPNMPGRRPRRAARPVASGDRSNFDARFAPGPSVGRSRCAGPRRAGIGLRRAGCQSGAGVGGDRPRALLGVLARFAPRQIAILMPPKAC